MTQSDLSFFACVGNNVESSASAPSTKKNQKNLDGWMVGWLWQKGDLQTGGELSLVNRESLAISCCWLGGGDIDCCLHRHMTKLPV